METERIGSRYLNFRNKTFVLTIKFPTKPIITKIIIATKIEASILLISNPDMLRDIYRFFTLMNTTQNSLLIRFSCPIVAQN